MELNRIYNQLKEAYSDKNLNLITGKLIELYKNKQHSKIREIANKISKYIIIDEEKDARCFSKLVILYHPDKGAFLRDSIKEHFKNNDLEKLISYSHILILDNLESIVVDSDVDDIDYHPEYFWDINQTEGFDFADEDELIQEEYLEETEIERSFYNAIKIREYGRVDIEFPSYYLEDFEEYELSECGIDSLNGIEYCIHVKTLDLSNNEIVDLSQLWDLKNIEELYLSNNQIGYIDTLSNLTKLKVIDISQNQIDDISPLLILEHLEYINLIGNPIPLKQLLKLKEKGIIVMY